MRVEPITFQWHPGMAPAQKQRSIDALHSAARQALGVSAILEISSRSRDATGRELSAFNLSLDHPRLPRSVSVECAFQGSKVFGTTGSFADLYAATSLDAKRDERVRSSGPVTGFDFAGETWPAEPKTAFYDWLYLTALRVHSPLATALLRYDVFTDIEFNPAKSFNCQAHAAALFLSLHRRGIRPDDYAERDDYLALLAKPTPPTSLAPVQLGLF